MSLALGHLPRRGGAQERDPHEDLDLAADPGERRPACRRRRPASTSTRCSPSTRPSGRATTRRSCSRPRAPSPTGPARRSSSSRAARSTRPTSRPGSCTGSRATRSSRSRPTSATRCAEKTLIRSDLYLADEVFMCGTAAEVTPVRSVDDQEIGVGPITQELQKAYLDTVQGQERPLGAVARARAEHDRAREPSRRADAAAIGALAARGSTSATRSSCSRCCARGGSRSGPTGPRFEELLAEAVGAPHCAAVSSGTAGPAPLHACSPGVGPGRRGDHLAVLVRRLRELRDLRGRDAGLRRHRPATRSTSTRRRSRPRSRRGRRRSSRSTSSATRASSTSCARSATGTGSRSSRTPARRSAPATRAGRSARTATWRRGPSTRTSRSRPARAARSRRARPRSTSCSSRSATRAASRRRAGSSTAGSASTTGSTTSRPRSGSASSSGSTRSSQARREVAERYTRAARRPRRRDAARRRRRPRPLVVRLRRQAAAGRRPRRRDGAARRRGDRDRALPAVDPPPVVHARALRLRRGAVPGERGRERADDGDPVPRAPAARGRRSASSRRCARALEAA